MYKNNENMLAKGNVDRQQLQSEIGTYAGLVNGVPNPLKQDPDPVVAFNLAGSCRFCLSLFYAYNQQLVSNGK